MTFSYNHFHDHDKACLFGKGNSDIFEGCRTISYHHNFLENIQGSRLPLQRGGHMHYMNNYQKGCEDGWDVREKSVGYLDACYFENTKSPVRSDRGGSLNINKADGYDLVFKGCNNLPEGYTNIDNAKISNTYPVTTTDWVPTQTDANYKVNNHDKTADVPQVLQKYAGAGKIEIYKTYTDNVPTEDVNEFVNAVKNYSTAPSYDEKGNKMTGASAAVNSAVATDNASVEYYTLGGVRMAKPQKGVNIVVKHKADGTADRMKVVVG